MTTSMRELRKERGLTLEKVGQRMGRSHTAVRRWEKGERQPELSEIARLAEIYGVPPAVIFEALLAMTRQAPAPVTTPALKVVPVQGVVQAGVWAEPEMPQEEWESPSLVLPIPELYRQSRVYAVVVRGTSMNLAYPEGTYLVCVSIEDLGEEPADGSHVIVERHDHSGGVEATCKKLVNRPDGTRWLMPESDDPMFSGPIQLTTDETSEVRIVGLVIGNFRPNK